MNAINAPLCETATTAQQRAPDFRMLEGMPLRDAITLGATKIAPRCARKRAAAVLAEWDLGDLEYPVGMIISELVTNAMVATRAAGWAAGMPPVRVWMSGARSGVYVLVGDAVPGDPRPREATGLDESGRGLGMIVPAFSADWGWYPVPGGKVTWALISNPPETP